MSKNKRFVGDTPVAYCTHERRRKPLHMQCEFYADCTDMITIKMVNQNGEPIRNAPGTKVSRDQFDAIRYDHATLLTLLGWSVHEAS